MRVFQDQRSYLKLCQPSMYDNYTGPFNYYNIPIYVFKSIKESLLFEEICGWEMNTDCGFNGRF